MADFNDGIYEGSRFKLVANPSNDLEVIIIGAIANDSSLQQRLEHSGVNKFHGEFALGVHIEQGIRYCRRMASRYEGWKRDERILVPSFLLHDLCKPDEEFFHYNKRTPELDHAILGADMADILLNVEDPSVLKIIRHHDDHYKLYNLYSGEHWKSVVVDKLFQIHFQEFDKREMEALIRFGFMDRYRPQPNNQKDLKKYKLIKKRYEEEMRWFINMTRNLRLVDDGFEVFS